VEGVAGTATVNVQELVPVQGVSNDFSKLRNAWLKK